MKAESVGMIVIVNEFSLLVLRPFINNSIRKQAEDHKAGRRDAMRTFTIDSEGIEGLPRLLRCPALSAKLYPGEFSNSVVGRDYGVRAVPAPG
jgi:hypothetical protein